MKIYLEYRDDYRTGRKIEAYGKVGVFEKYLLDNEKNTQSYTLKDLEKMDLSDDTFYKYASDYAYGIVDVKDIDNDKYNVFLILTNYISEQKVVKLITLDTLEGNNDLLARIYSDINDQKEFVVKGLTSGYKEDGYYPEPYPRLLIGETKVVPDEIKEQIEDDEYESCVAIIIKDNKLIESKKIFPQF